jgi:hypothetical protein
MRPSVASVPALLWLLALAACADPRWAKPGVSAETAKSDLAECQAMARDASSRDAAIESDILASRGHDWQSSGTLGAHKSSLGIDSYRQSEDMLNSCMASRGYGTRE